VILDLMKFDKAFGVNTENDIQLYAIGVSLPRISFVRIELRSLVSNPRKREKGAKLQLIHLALALEMRFKTAILRLFFAPRRHCE
jgi:hypothetical protein